MLLQEPKARNLFFLRHLNFFSSVPLSKLQEHINTSKNRFILAEHQEKRWSTSEFGSYYVHPVLPGFPDSTFFFFRKKLEKQPSCSAGCTVLLRSAFGLMRMHQIFDA